MTNRISKMFDETSSGPKTCCIVTIDDDGQIRYLDKDELRGLEQLGEVTKRRASHVHPTSLLLRFAFYLLRDVFGENGKVGNWTRKWKCLWDIDLTISGGPRVGPYRLRAEAISAEEAWLAENMAKQSGAKAESGN